MTLGVFSVEYGFDLKFLYEVDDSFVGNYVLDRLSVSPDSSSLSFHHDREGPEEYFPDFNKALVSVTINDELIFGGQIISSSIGHDRISLIAEGVGDIINSFPIHGASRKASSSFVKNTQMIFNELGRKDKQPLLPGGTSTIADTDLDTADENENQKKWTRGETLSYAASAAKQLANGGMSSLILWDQIVNGGGVKPLRDLGSALVPDDEQIIGGIASSIKDTAQSDNYIAYFHESATATSGIGGTLEMIEYYLPSRKKSVTFDPTTTSNLEQVPYEMEFNRDYNKPNKVYLFSGKRYLSTVLKIDLSKFSEDADEEYGLLILDEDKKLTVRYSYDFANPGDSGNILFEGPQTVKDVILNGKAGTISNIFPRISNYSEAQAGEPVEFLDEFEVYVRFDSDAFKQPDSEAAEILVGGKIWNGLKNNTEAPLHSPIKEIGMMEMFENKFDFVVNANQIIIEFSGIPNAKDTSGNYKTLEQIEDLVTFIKIPVVLEVDDRDLYLATISEYPSFSISASKVDPELVEYNLVEDRVEVETFEDLHPLKRKTGFDFYSSGAGIDTVDDEDLFEDQMISEVTDRAKMINNSSGNRLTLSIPTELFAELGSSFPKEIGDWINEIQGDGTNFRWISLGRNYILTGISYSLTDVVLEFT